MPTPQQRADDALTAADEVRADACRAMLAAQRAYAAAEACADHPHSCGHAGHIRILAETASDLAHAASRLVRLDAARVLDAAEQGEAAA